MTLAAAPAPVRVAMFDGPGVAEKGFNAAHELLGADAGIELHVVDARQIQSGVLDGMDVVVFMGGDGARQGRELGAEGRQRVRAFVERGGGYAGVCAGAYLALQGPERYPKLRLVAARNRTGPRWKRGVAPASIEAVGAAERLVLHFANGPLFARARVDGLPPYVELARFRSDIHKVDHGTLPGEMPGTPAIVAAAYGQGRVLLFSPHPLLDSPGVPRAELMTRAVRWLAGSGGVPATMTFGDVFGE